MRNSKWLGLLILVPHLLMANTEQTVTIYEATADGQGDKFGTISIQESQYGVVFKPALSGLESGIHGFHLHDNASCDPGQKDGQKAAALEAGGHFDPKKTNKHDTPCREVHLGDLPPLYATEAGEINQSVLAPRLTLKDLDQHALMIHQHGDNFADKPEPLGGGGARVACGVIGQ